MENKIAEIVYNAADVLNEIGEMTEQIPNIELKEDADISYKDAMLLLGYAKRANKSMKGIIKLFEKYAKE